MPKHAFSACLSALLAVFCSNHASPENSSVRRAVLQIVHKARACELKGQWHQSLNFIDEAIRLDPSDYRLYVLRGFADRKTGHFDKAENDFGRALALHATDADVFCFRATVREESGNASGAIEDYGSALKITPWDTDLLYLRGRLKYDQRDCNNALLDLDRAIKLRPSIAKYYEARALVQSAMGNTKAFFEDCSIADRLK